MACVTLLSIMSVGIYLATESTSDRKHYSNVNRIGTIEIVERYANHIADRDRIRKLYYFSHFSYNSYFAQGPTTTG